LLNTKLTLRIRSGPRLKARVRDMGDPLDVFGLGAYDFRVDWTQAQYVVDAGANVGSFTLFAIAHGARQILAVEPNPETYDLLLENIRLSGVEDRVLTLNRAVAATPGRTTLFSPKMSTAASILAGSDSAASAVTVEGVTLREVIESTGWPRVDLMKIDIEGSEYAVFGALDPDTISRVGVIFIECHSVPGCHPRGIALRLLEAGFKVAEEVSLKSTMLVANAPWVVFPAPI